MTDWKTMGEIFAQVMKERYNKDVYYIVNDNCEAVNIKTGKTLHQMEKEMV